MITTKKINDVVVKVAKQNKKDTDTRLAKGYKLFPEPYANIFICAKKKSGKTNLLFNILDETVGRDTHVLFFVSTIFKDKTYKAILRMLRKKGVNYHCNTSLKEETKDGSIDSLQVLVDTLTSMSQDEFEDDDEDNDNEKPKDILHEIYGNGHDEEDEQEKEKKEKYLAPKYIIVFDDLSTELKSNSLVGLLKKNRHFNAKILLCSQHYNDLLPSSRLQQDYLILFKNISKEKLKEIYTDISTPISIEEFYKVYNYCTKDKFNFLYCDLINDEFRKNFNQKIMIN
jgi:hypothetical protein